jgi:hypothetical protein
LAGESSETPEFTTSGRGKINAAEMDGPRRPPMMEPVDEDDAARDEIERVFRAKLMGLRRLPRAQRAGALQAAREWRQAALAGLRADRARKRSARFAAWKQPMPAPRLGG